MHDGGTSAGCGGVIRDYTRRWVLGFSYNIGTGSTLEAELWGIRIGLHLAWDMEYKLECVVKKPTNLLPMLKT